MGVGDNQMSEVNRRGQVDLRFPVSVTREAVMPFTKK